VLACKAPPEPRSEGEQLLSAGGGTTATGLWNGVPTLRQAIRKLLVVPPSDTSPTSPRPRPSTPDPTRGSPRLPPNMSSERYEFAMGFHGAPPAHSGRTRVGPRAVRLADRLDRPSDVLTSRVALRQSEDTGGGAVLPVVARKKSLRAVGFDVGPVRPSRPASCCSTA
jgi:hypothetical protein